MAPRAPTIVNVGYRSTNFWVVSAGTSRLLVDLGWPGMIQPLLANLARDQRRTIVAVTHEPHGAAHADRILVVKDGEIAGELTPGREERAAHVATRYAELVG